VASRHSATVPAAQAQSSTWGGGIKRYYDNQGVSGTILDLGGGMQTYTFTAPPAPFQTPPANQPTPRPQPGFDQKHQRDYNIFNPAIRYQTDNPLNPANQYNPYNPLNPANRYNPVTPFQPLR
jgi:hypothetical protein